MYEEINRIINTYRSARDTDYAILLNGEWGCGKTYYIEHALREAIEASGGHLLYASLHGVRGYDQVATQLMFSNIAHKLNCNVEDIRGEYWLGKVLRVIKEADSTCTKVIGQTVQHFLDKGKNVSYKIDKDSTLVVIDDIERVIDDDTRRELLGSIYEDYVRRGYHVLLIGDETKIKAESSYFECKEKYVRRTINVNVWQSDLVLDFAKSRCDRLNWLYETIEKQFKKFARSKKIVNLRVVAMMIDTIVDILASLDITFAKDYANFIFSATAPLVHAMACGLIVPEDIEDFACLSELQNILCFYSDKEKRSNLDSRMLKACRFFDEYCRDEEICFYLIKSIFRYVLTGYLDGVAIQSEITELFHKEDSPEGTAFKKLGEYWTAEENVVSESVRAVVGFLEAGLYDFDHILTIYQRFCEIKSGKYISEWCYSEGLQEMFLRYIKFRSKNEGLPPHDVLLRRGVCRHGDDKNGVARLYEEIDAFYSGLMRKADNDRVCRLFVALKNRDCIEADSLVKRVNGQWKLFADIVDNGKTCEVAELPVVGLRFLEGQAREHILDIINSAEFERDQIPAINAIVSSLESYIKTGKDSVSRNERLSELASVLKSSIKHMENYLATNHASSPL